MARVIIKKFALQKDGVVYEAGSVVELEAAEAARLSVEAPAEFEVLAEADAAPEIQEEANESKEETAEKPEDLSKWTVADLKQFCQDNDIELPAKATKAEILDIIMNEGEEEEEGELPPLELDK